MAKGHVIQKLVNATAFVVAFGLLALSGQSAEASAQGVVIYQAQAAGAVTNTTAEEYVAIYNNTSHDINVTNWCLRYNGNNISCLAATSEQTQLYLSAHSYALFMNPTLESLLTVQNSTFKADALFVSSGNVLAAANGSIQIVAPGDQVVDALGWGTGSAEGQATSGSIAAGKMLQRISLGAGLLKDTGSNAEDFEIVSTDAVYPRGGLYEFVVPIDLCLNTPDIIETTVPAGFIRDEAGNCYQDVCDNLSGLQTTVPNGYFKEGIDCLPILIQITELLPNAAGADGGKEFAELYNPSQYAVDLAGYSVQLKAGGKQYTFNTSSVLSPNEYLILSDTQLGFSLPNTSAALQLYMPNGMLLYETGEYINPKDDQAWALIDGNWIYTSIPTPGASNRSSSAEGGLGSGAANGLIDCGIGRYRNPETNRCRNIESAASVLVPCASDQERNPETNRCRKVASVTSMPKACASDQFRNPETNRCKKIASSSSTLKPCAPGQERNPATNRCRKIATAISGTGLEAAAQPAAASPFQYKTPIIGLLSAALLGYGGYEYRADIRNYLQKIREKRRGRPPG